MKRIAAVAVATLAMSLASAGAARADGSEPPSTSDMGCGGGYVAPALSTHLHYRDARWNIGSGADDGTLGLSAPRGWSFVRTPAGEGRFHSRSGLVLLSLRTTTEAGTPAEHMADTVSDLAGTSGLEVVGQHTQVVHGQTWSTLSYRYRSSMSEPRTVKVRWIAFGTGPGAEASLVLTVAGRPLDGHGLDAMLAHVTPTVSLAG
jgi:hypothetical protein